MPGQHPSSPSLPPARVQRRYLTRTQQRVVWTFSAFVLLILAGVIGLDRDHLSGASQPILAVLAAILAGLLTYFITGEVTLQLAWLRGTGGIAVFALVLLLWPRLVPVSGLYRIQVAVVDSHDEPIRDATVWSVPGGEAKTTSAGWELDIPPATLPENHRIILYVEQPSTASRARRELTLGSDLRPVVEIRLQTHGVMVHGRVLDELGRPLPNAIVSVLGRRGGVTTDDSGTFELTLPAARGQMICLRVEKEGFRSADQLHPAGAGPATVLLVRR
jgi:hypothetical protein